MLYNPLFFDLNRYFQHWHGITQNGTNFQDGSGWITQCPLVPGESYNYDFQVPDQVRGETFAKKKTNIKGFNRLAHSGITPTYPPNTVMDLEVPWLFMTHMILTLACTMLMMVCDIRPHRAP